MCKFHRRLNVHKPRTVFILSQSWGTARQEFMMSLSLGGGLSVAGSFTS